MKKFVTKLHRYLHDRGLKHRYFADKIEISTSSLHHILTGRYLPSIPVASRIQQQTRNSVTIEDWLDEYKDIDEAKDKHQDSLEDKQAD
jgi:predicted transcriptional regulator